MYERRDIIIHSCADAANDAAANATIEAATKSACPCGERCFEIRIGNNALSNVGRGTIPLRSQNNLNHFAGASALITEVTVPKLDGASKDAARISITYAQPHISLQITAAGRAPPIVCTKRIVESGGVSPRS